jgi:protein-serine/threonine kinase
MVILLSIAQMITGLPPFYSRNRETMFEKIMKAELNFPDQISEVRKDRFI